MKGINICISKIWSLSSEFIGYIPFVSVLSWKVEIVIGVDSIGTTEILF